MLLACLLLLATAQQLQAQNCDWGQTLKNGKCVCEQTTNSYTYSAAGCSSCDAKKGWYPRAVFTNPSSYKYPAGKVCILCKNDENNGWEGTVVSDGKCKCDIKNGYGYAPEPYGAGSAYTYCTKCSGDAYRELETKTGKCLCKKGYGVSPFGSSCVACPSTTSYVKDGYCYCKETYFYTTDSNACIKCPGPRYEVKNSYNKALPKTCGCAPGYEGRTNFFDNKLSGCNKCPADQTTQKRPNDYNACVCKDSNRKGLFPANGDKYSSVYKCVCRWGFKQQKDGSCVYTPQCAGKKFTIDYWAGSKLPSGWDGKSFPKSVLKTTPSATASVSSSPVATLSLKGSAWPKLPSGAAKGKVAVRIKRCTCVIHKDENSQFKYSVTKGSKGAALLTIDGGTTDRYYGGDYHDQNLAMRPGVRPVLPVNGTLAAGSAKTLSLLAPQYNPSSGPWLSGFDNVPIIQKYEVCHNVELLYWSANGVDSLSVTVPK